jgi:hypothetical protein
MKLKRLIWMGTLSVGVLRCPAATLYVSLTSTNPTPPYVDWSTAATNIQDAVDAASAGDFVVASNGIYNTGGRVVYGSLTNRVVINKALTVQSVGGPTTALIQGNAPVGNNGIRCVYMTNGAVLSGFTLTNGATRNQGDLFQERSGAGVWCESSAATVSNCVLVGNSAYQYGGGAFEGTLFNCVLTNNNAGSGGGGGAYSNMLVNCTLIKNFALVGAAGSGGGAVFCTLSNCLLVANNGNFSGGGARFSTLNGCVVSNNSGDLGGGLFSCVANNSLISSNSASSSGGGAFGGTLFNCLVTNNFAGNGGGGAASNTLFNCTLAGNRAVSPAFLSPGGGAYGCVLSNCVVVGNSGGNGGGVYFGVVNNSLIYSNSAANYGGGAYSNILNNSILRNNNASLAGGGAYGSTLVNCTVVSNTTSATAPRGGGGVYGGSSVNCVIYYNSSFPGPNFYFPTSTALNYCCTTPLPINGPGNITNEPGFVNLAGEDFHLQSNSPCINSGWNAYVTNATDFDGNPRIVGETVDIGAYEYQTPTSVLSYAWAQQYGLPTDGSVDYLDLDGTGMNNWQKWIAGLNPTNPASVLAMLPPAPTNNSSGITVSWHSVNTRAYYLQRATDLTAQSAFSAVQSNIVGQAGTTRYTDVTATNSGSYFYRIGVQ